MSNLYILRIALKKLLRENARTRTTHSKKFESSTYFFKHFILTS